MFFWRPLKEKKPEQPPVDVLAKIMLSSIDTNKAKHARSFMFKKASKNAQLFEEIAGKLGPDFKVWDKYKQVRRQNAACRQVFFCFFAACRHGKTKCGLPSRMFFLIFLPLAVTEKQFARLM